ncbi:diacylglycerol kinase family protein [uncultured Thiohalocapsa sp.]|uniref:diacylglycerol/lipid kinase family protein n=1 Tax=uncultured Thiohalocapsa sp. TaxID=768990 RepID=UPI0025DFFBF6|nr:diacylglycerol kinase family protein [uncultured Thiohalocapsa sp.]
MTRSPANAPTPDICIVLNHQAGADKDGSFQAELDAALDRHPGRFHLQRVDAGGDLRGLIRRAVAAGFSTIAAAGGDGTIGAVAQEIAGTQIVLGVIPLGTFNYVARGLGIPLPLADAVDTLATGSPRPLPVGEVNGRIFLNNASLGIYPAILAQREGVYQRFGRSRIAAHWSVVKTFLRLYRPLSVKVTVDGQAIRKRTPLVFIARSAFQMESFGLQGAEQVRKGRFAVFLAPDVGRLGLMAYALRLAWGDLRAGRDVEQVFGDHLLVETRGRHQVVACDGERERLATPLRFRVHHAALKVIAPASAQAQSQAQ